MADFKKLSWMRDRLKTTPRVTTKDLTPSLGWTEDHERHQMLVDLPGFKKGDIKLQVDESGTIAISGGRRVSDTKRVQFERTAKAPEDADTTNISMKFVGDTLEVSMPKVVKRKGKEPEVQNEGTSNELGEEKREESANFKEAKEKEEQEVQNGARSSDSEAKEKEEQEVQKEAQGSDSRDESQSGNAVEEKQDPEPEPQKGDLNDVREGIESTKAAKEKEEPEMKEPPSSSDLRDEVHEESEISESDKVTENKEPEPQNVASDSNVAEQKRNELEEQKEEAADKKDEHEKEKSNLSAEQNHHAKGKDIARNEDTQQKSIIGKLIDQKAILLASIISFTLGVLLSPKFHKPPPK